MAAHLPAAGPAPLRWPAEAIWEAVAPRLPGFTVEILPEIDSTNSELMRRLRAGRTEPTLLVAESQTAGRGRMGRSWSGQVGDALMFSLALPLAPRDWSGLSLAVGVSVAESLHPDVGLKWPNDLWWQSRKLAGILIETAAAGPQRHAVIGVGINLVAPRETAGLRTPPAGLRELLPGADAPATLARVVAPLVEAVLAFETGGFAPFRGRFESRDVLRGQALQLSDGTSGIGCGVSDDGALQVQTGAALTRVTSSEVSVRPARADA
jgi:BirA family biotin operon repressor/biotin-[acetyl-CoA-carboxylase] ligase